jgi:hypothetical protein
MNLTHIFQLIKFLFGHHPAGSLRYGAPFRSVLSDWQSLSFQPARLTATHSTSLMQDNLPEAVVPTPRVIHSAHKSGVIWTLLLGFATLVSCNLDREVEIVLPEYDSQRVLECYLEPGQPFRLLLSNSSSYFDPFPTEENLLLFLDQILERDADVRITFGNREIVLRNEINIDFETLKFFNYVSDEIVPEDFTLDYNLEIILKDGRTITGQTRVLPPVPIDSLALEFNDRGEARTLIFIKDDRSVPRYYRRMLHFGSLDSLPSQDFIADNSIVDNGLLAFGHGFSAESGDTIINTVFTIDKAYFDFLVSVNGSIAANGNPFAQPGVIFSNIRGSAGAIGIFTGITFDRVVTIVP